MDYLRDGKLGVVFVGCGGTFWHAGNFFTYLLKALQPGFINFVDYDEITEANAERQWCDGEWIGKSKSEAARAWSTPAELLDRSIAYPMGFAEWARENRRRRLPQLNGDEDILLIVNVDNDQARLEIREWAMQYRGTVVMVMSGCDTNYGQVYYGVYGREGAKHDWLPFHTDVGNREAPVQKNDGGCGAQSAASNFITGSLFAMAIAEGLRWFYGEFDKVGEWYWRHDKEKGTTKVWTQAVAPLAVEPEEVL
jgi:hypothetical protein